MSFFCGKACPHNGVCSLEEGHSGFHDASGYCQFSDEEAIPRELADRRFSEHLQKEEGIPKFVADILADL